MPALERSEGFIFIASSSQDRTAELVCRDLVARGRQPIMYQADCVVDGSAHCTIDVTPEGVVKCEYEGRCFDPARLGAAWYRRPETFGGKQPDKLRGYSLDQAFRMLQNGLWNLIPDERWLNSPYTMRRANGKLGQLVVAAAVGFSVPQTVVSNQWDRVRRLPSDKLVAKTASGTAMEFDAAPSTLVYTTQFANDDRLPFEVSPYPAIWQTYIPKAREWRVTVVGDELFSAAIYTSPDARDDWRKHQLVPEKVTFRAETLPTDAGQKCIAVVQALGLRFGAIDLIETPEGEMIFLEVNPNGEFGWLQVLHGLPIGAAIASELIKIAAE